MGDLFALEVPPFYYSGQPEWRQLSITTTSQQSETLSYMYRVVVTFSRSILT